MEYVVALVTPKTLNRWNGKELVDKNSLWRLTSYLSLYFDSFLFLGFSGEFNILQMEEAKEIIKFAEEIKFINKEKIKIIINVSRNNKEETYELIKKSDFADFLMILFPYKNISYDDGMKIIKETKKPFIFYYSPLIKNLTRKELENIIKEKNVFGIKDSISFNYEERIMLAKKYKKEYFCGIDRIFLKELKKGNKLKLISGTLNFIPDFWKNQQYEKIEKIIEMIEKIENYISFPAIAKYCLSTSPPFYPLINYNIKLSDFQIKKLEELAELYKKLKFIK